MKTRFDDAVLRQLVEVMESSMGLILDEYVRQSAETLVDIRRAIGSANWNELAGAAHNLKGSSATVGAVSIFELCARLEQLSRAGPDASELEALVVTLESEYLESMIELGDIRRHL